jgi:hypothetical protein
VKDCCCKVSAQSLKFQILESIQELPQGVRAGVFLKTRVMEKAQRNLCLKHWKEAQQLWFVGGQVFVKILVHFAENIKEEFDGQNPPWRIREVPEIIRSRRGARRLCYDSILQCKIGKIRP